MMESTADNHDKEHKQATPSDGSAGSSGKSIRGSGFTYDEDEKRTDQSIPIKKGPEPDQEADDIVPLPDLGQPNRP